MVWGNKLGVKVVVVCGAFFDIRELVVNVSWYIMFVDKVVGGDGHP